MASLAELLNEIAEQPAIGIYITAPNCGVCVALKPKLKQFLEQHFPKIIWKEIDAEAQPEIPANFQSFVVPTFLLFLDGKEVIRRSRAFGLEELAQYLQRPYQLLFED